MPRPRSDKPKLCLHKPSGRAFVTLMGKCVYLGRHGTREAQDAYDRLIGEWIAQGRPRVTMAGDDGKSTVTQIILAFWAAAQEMYPACRRPEGKHPASELGSYFDALKVLRRLYGTSSAEDFGPLKLEVVRNEMVRSGLCRDYVNDQIGRIRRVFKWAESKELLDKRANVHHRLSRVAAQGMPARAFREGTPGAGRHRRSVGLGGRADHRACPRRRARRAVIW